jgi:carbamoyl-phosphate synthase/aspartate carbamoyltransferase/dihydroorotase
MRPRQELQAAMLSLDGNFLHVDGQGDSSATKEKQEPFRHNPCLECYIDVVVLRHPVTGSVPKVAKNTSKSMLNVGDGIGFYPTQPSAY